MNPTLHQQLLQAGLIERAHPTYLDYRLTEKGAEWLQGLERVNEQQERRRHAGTRTERFHARF